MLYVGGSKSLRKKYSNGLNFEQIVESLLKDVVNIPDVNGITINVNTGLNIEGIEPTFIDTKFGRFPVIFGSGITEPKSVTVTYGIGNLESLAVSK